MRPDFHGLVSDSSTVKEPDGGGWMIVVLRGVEGAVPVDGPGTDRVIKTSAPGSG